jgi:transposase
MAQRKRRKFNPDFKTEAVRLARVGDRSIQQIAADLDLTESSLRNWINQADVDAGQSPSAPDAMTTAEKTELSELRREVKKLRQERDILKAAATYLPARDVEVCGRWSSRSQAYRIRALQQGSALRRRQVENRGAERQAVRIQPWFDVEPSVRVGHHRRRVRAYIARQRWS